MFDAAVLDRLEQEIGDVLAEIVGDFATQSDRMIQDLLAAGQPASALRPLAHDLKSNARTLGFEALAARADLVELACRAGDGARAQTLARDLPDIRARSLAALNAARPNLR